MFAGIAVTSLRVKVVTVEKDCCVLSLGHCTHNC